MVEQDIPPLSSDNTSHENDEAHVLSVTSKIWIKAALADQQLQLLRKLKNLKLGTAEVEEFLNDLEDSKKSKDKNKQKDKDLAMTVMDRKVVDADKSLREIEGEKTKWRRKLDSLFGKNSRTTRRMIKLLRRDAENVRKEIKKKNNEKVDHLVKKYRVEESKKENSVPEKLLRYKDLSIYSIHSEENENKEEKVEILILGDLEVDENEKEVLGLPPKYSIMEKLSDENFNVELEMGFTKYRWTVMKENQEEVDEEVEKTEAEKNLEEEIEIESKQPYDPL